MSAPTSRSTSYHRVARGKASTKITPRATGKSPSQTTLLPDCIDDYVDKDNPVRAVDAFVDMLDLAALGFDVEPEATGRPGYHPATLLKLYVYGYLNQVQSSRRLERE